MPTRKLEAHSIEVEYRYWPAEPTFGVSEEYEIIEPTNLTHLEYDKIVDELFEIRAAELDHNDRIIGHYGK
tara:strand:+ start:628 stop:840 length:213 start_codon:yes stop_codon:yes gene_type:complete